MNLLNLLDAFRKQTRYKIVDQEQRRKRVVRGVMDREWNERIAQAMANKACTEEINRTLRDHAGPWTDADQFLFLKRLERTGSGLARLVLADSVLGKLDLEWNERRQAHDAAVRAGVRFCTDEDLAGI